jgi:serine protease Do
MNAPSIASTTLGLALLLSCAQAQRGGKLEEEDYLNGANSVAAFKAAGLSARASTVKLLRKGKVFCLGTAISADGYIATKATELADKNGVLPDLEKKEGEDSAVIIQVETPEGEKLMGELVGYERTDDIAIIKVAKGKLTPVDWTSSGALFQGQWVAAMGRQTKQLNTGVISAHRRQIDRRGGVIGIGLDNNDDADEIGVGIIDVRPNSPARKAGIKTDDLIVEIEDREIRSRRQLSRIIGDFDPGDTVRFKVQRGNEKIGVEIILGSRSKLFDMYDRNQQMSGKTSVRKAGFTDALQHELPLPPDAMGGPLVDLEGRAVGLNIARADRVTTFALPAELVQDIARRIIEDASDRKPATE